jgi:hypothetical protein
MGDPYPLAGSGKENGSQVLRRVLRLWHSQLPNPVKAIQNSKLVLLFLDILEELKDLSPQEWNFRSLVQKHIENLLEQQRLYYWQRGNIKWPTLGDENTKFFHANATIKHNKNAIRALKNASG